MSERSWGSTVLGWFIVREDGEPDATAAPTSDVNPDIVTDVAAPDPATFFTTEPPAAPGGRVDFDGVFNAAGIDRADRERVARASELLASLPSETPVALRKQIVEASMKAFGVPVDKIIETGVSEIQALEGYIRAGAVDTQKLQDESGHRIQEYEAEIRNLRTVMEQRVQEQQAVATVCNARKLDVQRVLEFFGQEAVARVVRESPRLHDPSAPTSTPA
jgi:hypothetical protein